MDEEKRNLVYRVVRVAIVLWVGLMLFQCGGGGDTEEPGPTDTPEPPTVVDDGGTDGPGPTDTPEPIVAVGIDYDVRRERAEVRAHIDGLSDSLSEFELVTLTNSNWQDMLDHGRVATNGVGRAELRADCAGATACDCEAVILYEGSNLVSRPCHPEESAGTCATGQALLINCDICFETLSSRTCPEGTWVTITYLGESEITIVTVGEGVAKVTPVTALHYAETAPFDFEFETRTWSRRPIVLEAESVPSESGEATLPRFLYTAPDAKLEVITAYAEEMAIELPPAGVSLPVSELSRLVDPEFGLPPVLRALEWEQPYLPLWFYDISKSAYKHGDILFPPSEPPYPDLGLSLILDFDGDQLADPRVQEAFVYAIDKEYVITAALAEEEVSGFHALIDAIPVDAFTIPYDPEVAYALLDEAAFDRDLGIFVVFPTYEPVAYAAKLIAGALSEVGIKLELVPVPMEDMDAARQEFALDQQPAIAVFLLRPSVCEIEAEGEFAALWEFYDARLGCPLYPDPTVIQDAEQPFENGHMFWRMDTQDIYVVYEDGPRAGSYDLFTDVWEEGDPEYTCSYTPPPGLVLPVRGFGVVWCEELGGPDAAIGWALEEEEGYFAGQGDPLVQDFEDGIIFRDSAGTETGMAYVLFRDVDAFKHVSY